MQGGKSDDGLLDLVPGPKISKVVIERELSIPSFSLVKSLEHSAVDRYLQFARHCASTVVRSPLVLEQQ